MAENNQVEKSLLERIQDLLERKPGHCDVVFCVGKEKKIVKALKIILKAASSFLEMEFEEKWEVAVIAAGEGIPLPDFDPTAFELFLKLTSQDTWSLDILEALNLSPNQILNLLSICRRFEMKKGIKSLEILAAAFMQSFDEYKDTDDFLQLTQTNLKSVLLSEDIGINELDVFHSAIRWAEFQCEEMNVDPREKSIREVLGDCLFEIRFPVMSSTEFTEATEAKNILTAEESLAIYRFIGLEASKKLEFDATKIPFKTIQRKGTVLILPSISTLRLSRDSKIVEDPPFISDGSANYESIVCEKKIKIYGLGFLGPIENDGFYDVTVQIFGNDELFYASEILEKRISAQKGETFYFFFDTPIDIEAGSADEWSKVYQIEYNLKGPNTSAFNRSLDTLLVLKEGGTKFGLLWQSCQLAEVLFKVM